jgi:RNA polymerase sigma factor (sigma-70 family)
MVYPDMNDPSGAGTEPMQLERHERDFTSFVTDDGAKLRRALVAAYGVDVGTDVTNDALAWAWEHWDRVEQMERPVGYLYRVGQSAARRHHRWRRPMEWPPEVFDPTEPTDSPRLDQALNALTPRQRVAALLVHGHGWSYAEVAEATSVSVGSVRNDLHRAMNRLRRQLETS